MNNTPYNKLPEDIKRKFNITYSQLVYDKYTIILNKDEKWGALSSYDYLLKPIYNSVGFNKNLKLFEAMVFENNAWNPDKNTFLYFDLNGKLIWQSQKGEVVRIDHFGNIFLKRANKTGLLDKEGFTERIAPKYQHLGGLSETLFKASQDGKYGIINRDDVNILAFDFDEIFNVIIKNKVIVRKNENYFSFDFENNTLRELPYSKILNPSSNTYKAPSPASTGLFKSITDLEENTDYDEYEEMIRYKGKWGITDGAGDAVIPNHYCFVDFLRNPEYFKVGIGEMDVMEITDEDDHNRVSIKNVKWGIVDINNKMIVPVEYDWIDEVESTVWVVYKGGVVFYNDDDQEDYWTIKNGKLGVYNLNKLITPIEYDVIKKNWFRIKEYIFVQKGRTNYFDDHSRDYDVFTLEGVKIKVNKPNPKDYTYFDNE